MKSLKEIRDRLLSVWKEKLGSGGARRLFASRAFLVTGCALLIAAAVTVSALLGRNAKKPVADVSETDKTLGNSVLVGGDPEPDDLSFEPSGTVSESSSDLMTMSVRNRKDVREQAMAVLRQIADNPDAMPDDKENALASIAAIMHDMEAEANIETLAAAKGIPQLVAVISGNQCSLIVDAARLDAAVLTQLQELVYEQSGILPASLKVILAADEA